MTPDILKAVGKYGGLTVIAVMLAYTMSTEIRQKLDDLVQTVSAAVTRQDTIMRQHEDIRVEFKALRTDLVTELKQQTSVSRQTCINTATTREQINNCLK